MRRILVFVLGFAACAYDPPDGKPGDAGADAPPILICPAVFNLAIPGSRSRYYLESSGKSWREAEAACELAAGHLFVPDGDAESDAMRMLLDDDQIWVGLLQRPNQSDPATGWFAVTGAALVTARWQSSKPDDGGDENGSEQVATLDDEGFDDQDSDNSRGSICECDGLPVDTALVQLIPQ